MPRHSPGTEASPMIERATEHDIATIPKVELHVHLNGSITEATASELAHRHGADPDKALELVDGRYPGRYPDFEGFLHSYLLANSFVRTPEDLEFVAAEFARGQAAQHVLYTEAIFTAGICVRNGMDPTEMWAALRRGLAVCEPETRVALVIDAIRDLGPAEAAATVELVEQANAPIIGLELTGIEGTWPVEAFVPFRRSARRLGLGFEVHAGEMGPPSSIVDTLDVLEADRIAHGVAAIHDRALLDRLARQGSPLVVCPSSNVGIGLFPSLEAHPVAEFWRHNLEFSISADDPPFFHTTLVDELRHVVELAGLSPNGLRELQRRAARNSFATPAQKATLLGAIERWRSNRNQADDEYDEDDEDDDE
jgi:adenosine deaminase